MDTVKAARQIEELQASDLASLRRLAKRIALMDEFRHKGRCVLSGHVFGHSRADLNVEALKLWLDARKGVEVNMVSPRERLVKITRGALMESIAYLSTRGIPPQSSAQREAVVPFSDRRRDPSRCRRCAENDAPALAGRCHSLRHPARCRQAGRQRQKRNSDACIHPRCALEHAASTAAARSTWWCATIARRYARGCCRCCRCCRGARNGDRSGVVWCVAGIPARTLVLLVLVAVVVVIVGAFLAIAIGLVVTRIPRCLRQCAQSRTAKAFLVNRRRGWLTGTKELHAEEADAATSIDVSALLVQQGSLIIP